MLKIARLGLNSGHRNAMPLGCEYQHVSVMECLNMQCD